MHYHQTAREHRLRRHRRVRAKVRGTGDRPRLSVFRSLRHLFVQLINDDAGRTLLALSDRAVGSSERGVERSRAFGKLFAQEAKAKGITQVVFDRGGYHYHGHVRALAEGAREGGLQF